VVPVEVLVTPGAAAEWAVETVAGVAALRVSVVRGAAQEFPGHRAIRGPLED